MEFTQREQTKDARTEVWQDSKIFGSQQKNFSTMYFSVKEREREREREDFLLGCVCWVFEMCVAVCLLVVWDKLQCVSCVWCSTVCVSCVWCIVVCVLCVQCVLRLCLCYLWWEQWVQVGAIGHEWLRGCECKKGCVGVSAKKGSQIPAAVRNTICFSI